MLGATVFMMRARAHVIALRMVPISLGLRGSKVMFGSPLILARRAAPVEHEEGRHSAQEVLARALEEGLDDGLVVGLSDCDQRVEVVDRELVQPDEGIDANHRALADPEHLHLLPDRRQPREQGRDPHRRTQGRPARAASCLVGLASLAGSSD